ncbi:MAG TPA: hypothetical protein VLY83_05370 [Methanoregula sp.]|nr:hypothetical protein [Methanoregula sp.]
MGICTDIMHDFVLQEIKRIYSTYDGWKITPRRHGNSYDTIFVIERVNMGSKEIAKVLASFKREITLDMIEELTVPEKTSDGSVPRRSFAVMVPAGADVSRLPPDLKILTMKAFAFDGKELIWIKKPVRKTGENG